MATIAKREPIVGYPFVNIFSLSDGPIDNSTGVPYMYVTEFDMSVEERWKISFSNIETNSCLLKFLGNAGTFTP